MENSREVSQKAKNRITIWPSNFTPGYTSKIPGLWISPEEGHGSPFQYFCMENSMNKGVWWSTKSQILLKQLSMNILKNIETLIQKDTGTPMFTVALFTIAKTWKLPKCPSRWMEKEDVVHSIQWSIIQSFSSVHFSSVSQSCLPLCDPMDCSTWASLSITNSWSLLKLMSIESVMPSNHLILCHSLLLLPSIFPSIRVFSNELVLHIRWPKYRSSSFSISPSNE